ncbi:hypothetical protein GQ43DRAFT_145635 [Delitschia confertaspora ATCC 74209]|uniref:Uncharacterized protein n=1 Tax=Delitschia confertaspora ATCC 74209 TaxID=1513339 RepID=A0A9P4JGM1_9PLEO|nr:hypothetical protein GQ43DRAFT_145635 [Delitschia confertaspora ATCC 74209]
MYIKCRSTSRNSYSQPPVPIISSQSIIPSTIHLAYFLDNPFTMPSSFSLTAALVTALLVFDQTTFANPVPQQSNSPALSLLTRNDENYVGCSDKQKKKLKKDFEDAEKLAEYADGIDTKSKAWSHYFRTTGDGQTEDLKYAKSQWKLIANYDDNKYRFSVRCGDDKHVDCKNGKR